MRSNKCVSVKGLIIFYVVALIISGTLNTLTTKMQLTSKSIDKDGEEAPFYKPWFVTLNMLTGMLFAGLLDKCLRKLCPAPTVRPDVEYERLQESGDKFKPSYGQKVLIIAIPAALDMFGVAFNSGGMMYLSASIWQMLRGASIIFCGIFSILFLKRRLYAYHWLGIFLCLFGLASVGLSSVLGSRSASANHNTEGTVDLLTGMGLVMAGQALQAGQIIAEEYLMKDVDIPAMQIVGWEGFWGTLMMVVLVYPVLWFLHGSDHGHMEDWYDTLVMLSNSALLMWLVALYFFSCAIYNASGISVTGALSGTHRQMMDASRTSVIWIIGLMVHLINPDAPQGEKWTNYSYLQLLGFFILLIGQSIYGGTIIVPRLYYAPKTPQKNKFVSPGSLLVSPAAILE